MAKQNVFTNLINKGKVSRLKDWNYQVYDDRATLLADTYPATAQDGDASFTMALAVAENEVWFWNGAVANTDTTSAGNGTNWHSSDKDSEIVLGVTNPPIDSYNEATLVTAVAPTGLTANTKFVTWVDASGKEHLYSVTDPIGTPVFTEITTNKLMRVVDLTVTSEAEVLALVPLRLHTIYVNTTTGQEFLVDEDGGITTLKGKNRVGQVEWKPVTLVANTVTTFDLNNDAGIEIQDGEGAVAGTNEYALSANLLLNGINILDATNGLPLATNLYSVKPLTASTFTIESNVATDVIATFDGLLTKVEQLPFYPLQIEAVNWLYFMAGTTEADFLTWLMDANPNAEIQAGSFSFVNGEVSMMTRGISILALSGGLDVLSITHLPFMVDLNLSSNTNLTSIPYLRNGLTNLDTSGCSSLSSLPTLPISLDNLTISECNFTQATLDQLATEFLVGSLPKTKWGSSLQVTTDQPSAGVQAQLTANVNIVNF